MPDDAAADAGPPPPSRRAFLAQLATAGVGVAAAPVLLAKPRPAKPADAPPAEAGFVPAGAVPVTLRINKKEHTLKLEPRVTLLDALREHLEMTGTKKGCDHGQCGACTLHVDGKRVLSCLTLAITAQGKEITTIEGLAEGDTLHPVQAAFVECDGFQCGFCTPGQIMSATACLREGHANSDAEIREWMSGNLCRCGAYPNIVEAVKTAATAIRTKGGRA